MNSAQAYQMIALEKALKLELLGMKRRGQAAYAIIKQQFGLTGNRQKVYDQFLELKNETLGICIDCE